MTGLPIASKGQHGARFAEVDAPVTHMAGATETVSPKQRQKQAARPAADLGPIVPGPPITEVGFNAADPRGRFVAWVIEREAIRRRKEAGQPRPWTDEPILSVGRFCNVYREHDAVTRWITANVVERFRDDPDLWFGLALARCINEPDALAELLPHLLPFAAGQCLAILQARQARADKCFRTDAYKPPTPDRKDVGTAEFLINEVLVPMWRERERLRPQSGETLAAYSARLEQCWRIGPFLAGQVIADTKFVPPLQDAADWWTFARPGPGSERGLNRVLGRPVKASWSDAAWHRELMQKHAETAPLLTAAGLAPLDAQNLQNCCCEFDKWERAREAGGKTARRYVPAGAEPPAKRPKKAKAKSGKAISGPERAAVAAADAPRAMGAATPAPAENNATAAAAAAAPPHLAAGIKFLITRADKAQLRARGWSVAQIAEMKPQQAADILAQPKPEEPAAPSPADTDPNGPVTPNIPAHILDGAEQSAAAPSQPTAAPSQTLPPSSAKNNGTGNGSGNEYQRHSSTSGTPPGGSKSAAAHDSYAGDHAGEPFSDSSLLLRGYQFTRSFDYTLSDATQLYEQRRYELRADIPAIKGRPRKRFLPRHQVNGAWVVGAGDRHVLYNWPAIMRAGPGSTVYVTEGEGNANVLIKAGLLATTVLSHKWAPECVAALTDRHLIILQDHDDEGRTLATAAQRKLAPVAASTRIVPASHLWVHLPGKPEPAPGDDVADWLALGGDAKMLLDICREIPAEGTINFTDTPLTTQQWLTRDLPEADLLLGHVLSTSTRMLLFADTGLGKTHFTMAVSGHSGVGKDFLHWHCPRPARILYIDGEMSLKLFRERIADVARRLGGPPPGAYFFNKADVPGFAPLNTRDGQAAVWALIEEVERRSGQKLDAVCFDSIMALLLGDMKEEDAWRDTMPLVHALTARRIGQLWVHHTGHDTSHGYGTKTREWQMDTVARLEAIENTPPDIIAFRLSFPKARERTPANRLDFTETSITLANDQWTGVLLSNARGKINESLTRKFYEALLTAAAGSSVARTGSYLTASLDEWRAQCLAWGLLDSGKADSVRSLFSRHKLRLIAANWIACSAELAWVLP
jgi:hypothetical protein